jgi:RNA polymerase sigma-70 factor, ECF subfamily
MSRSSLPMESPTKRAAPEGLAERLEAERSFLWAVSYRLTGSAADADDVVQDTFVRALERPPADVDRPWRPWLTRVALNLGRDLLRKRRRRTYEGPWLPEVIEHDAAPPSFVTREPGPAARYDRLESVSIAFLLALEALTPAQRAVLLLRDVFEYSVRETAEALDLSEANVKTLHLRARRAMTAYDRSRTEAARGAARASEALQRFLDCLAAHDVAGVESLLAEGVRAYSDGGGEFHAARVPVVGVDRVSRFFLGLMGKVGAPPRVEPRTINGVPSVLLTFGTKVSGWAPRVVLQLRVDAGGRVDAIYVVLATRKLAALAPDAP